MKTEDQIKALAELDGWKLEASGWYHHSNFMSKGAVKQHSDSLRLLPYLTSYDAIIPLIQKVINTPELKVKFLNELRAIIGRRSPKNKAGIPLVSDFDMLTAYTEELCEALLRATGKWKE